MMPVFINKFDTAMKSAVITKSIKPARVKVFASRFDLKEWQILQNYTIRYSDCESVPKDSPIPCIPTSRLRNTAHL